MSKRGFAYLFLVVFISSLTSCSVHKPAPVTTAGLYSPSNKGRLQQSHYTVKQGDTLYSIAWLANLDPNELAAINNIPSPYLIYVDQKLSLLAKRQNKSGNISLAKQQKANKKTKKTESSSKQSEKQDLQKTNKKQKQSKKASETVIKVAKTGSSSTKSVKKPNKKLEPKNDKSYSGDPKQEKANKKSPYKNVVKWQMPTAGEIVSRFSSAETGNNGINIEGKRGQAVYSAASGKVVYAGSALRGYGKLIIVKHNDDYLSAYAHNDKFHVKEQEIVKAGQLIADMGNTDAPQIMLHFEIRYRGKSVNPEKFLPE